MTRLFDSLTLGDLTLPNRIIMAPLTRMRSKQPGNIPYELNAEYYAQRASAGLIISEATQISQQGQGYPATPGVHSLEQIEGWKLVTDAVHKQGGKIFLQLWHVGRVSHPDFQEGDLPIGPSALPVEGEAFTAEGMKPIPIPRALDTSEMPNLVEQYAHGARLAMEAGFDGVELHAASGYLHMQFLTPGVNVRTDQYGGGAAQRARFVVETLAAMVTAAG